MEFLTVSNAHYLNAKLQKATDQCRQYDLNVRNNQFAIAYIIGKVDSEGLYKDDGFENCAEWVIREFGVAKTLAYNLIAVGKEYTRTVINAKGKIVGFCSNIITDTPLNDFPALDFTVDQISRLRSLGRDKVVELYQTGSLKPNMTTSDMMKLVKLHKAKKITTVEPASDAPVEPASDVTAEHASDTSVEPTSVTTASDAPVEPSSATTASEVTTEPDHEEPGEVIDTSRSPEYDSISTRYLIAELYMRGFKVYREGREVKIRWHEDIQDWKVDGQEEYEGEKF